MRSSSSMPPTIRHFCSSSLCSPQFYIAIIILLYIYLTLENSISLHQKILTSQKDSISSTSTSLSMDLAHQSLIQNDTYITPPPPPPPSPPPPSPPPPSIESQILPSTGNFYEDFNIHWGDGRGKVVNNGTGLTLSLDRYSGSGFESRKHYLFAKISMQIKLVPNNSAGTVTTYYLSSPEGPNHDEIDFEFLGNLTGEPYTLHTNIYCNGKGNREQQFYLWFDPTTNFHTYSILWNPKRIIFYVDGTPIRLFENRERITGVPYPKRKPMRIYSSLWNADDWATQGGKVGTDWSLAPFVAEYRGFEAKGCVWLEELNVSGCDEQFRYLQVRKNSRRRRDDDRKWLKQGGLDVKGRERMNWVQQKYMTYDYCKDVYRFPEGLPRECLQGDRRHPKKKSP